MFIDVLPDLEVELRQAVPRDKCRDCVNGEDLAESASVVYKGLCFVPRHRHMSD